MVKYLFPILNNQYFIFLKIRYFIKLPTNLSFFVYIIFIQFLQIYYNNKSIPNRQNSLISIVWAKCFAAYSVKNKRQYHIIIGLYYTILFKNPRNVTLTLAYVLKHSTVYYIISIQIQLSLTAV